MPRLLIADDHPLFRLALAQAVREVMPGARVLEADTLEAARTILSSDADIDLLLLDLHMPGNRGLLGLVALRAEFPAVAVVMISANDDPLVIRRALAYGAAGYIPKRADLEAIKRGLKAVLDCAEYVPDGLRAAVYADADGGSADRELAPRLASLTPQQLRVLVLVAEGRLNKQIADHLGIQERTVKAHLTSIFEKLGVRNRTQASALLHHLEIADPVRRL
ncbi:MAG: response regulator [Lysobacterales bacterium]